MVYQKKHALRGRVNLALKQVKTGASMGRRLVESVNRETLNPGDCAPCEGERQYDEAKATREEATGVIDELPRPSEYVPELDEEDESDLHGIEAMGAAE